ncbi:hypothetical protein R5W24_005815 [Gemmata sp. JC717]|uniref:hypothetical protein n=1 Tax=Gemmata algarum TaxID=2975278 RepID=UPI0021BB96E3|nr:hypothetical protein [Gemmata algarum]MDY3556646.1 hypothetical protein [Gemmata algarum]
MANAHETRPLNEPEPAPVGETDADMVRQIRSQPGPVRTVPAAAVNEALRKLDALAANGPPAPGDVAAVIAETLK